jgi:hypothetical protein
VTTYCTRMLLALGWLRCAAPVALDWRVAAAGGHDRCLRNLHIKEGRNETQQQWQAGASEDPARQLQACRLMPHHGMLHQGKCNRLWWPDALARLWSECHVKMNQTISTKAEGRMNFDCFTSSRPRRTSCRCSGSGPER